MDEKVIQHMALLMSVNCVRKTVLDDYFNNGQISEADLNAFITEATDKLFTFLTYLLDKSEQDKQSFLEVMNTSYPHNWPAPKLSAVFEEAVHIMQQQKLKQ
jgi:hypothetical protein